MFTGGQKRLKSKVNSYVLGAQAQISVPISCPSATGERANRRAIDAGKTFMVKLILSLWVLSSMSK
jgi:hypothetical protein